MSKRTPAALALLLTSSLVLAACRPAAQPFTCNDAIGCLTVAPGAPLHVAYALVISGGNESLGVDSRRGIEIAIDDKNGTVLGHPVQLSGVDTLCKKEGGQAAATSLAADQTIVGIIGPSCSSEAAVAAPILSDAGFTLISPSATAPGLTDPAARAAGFFRTAHNDAVQGAVAAEFAYNVLGVRKAATVNDGSNYTASLAKVFATRFHELGGQVVDELSVKPDATDMSATATQLAADGPDLIYYPIFIAAGGFLTIQSKATPALAKVKLMGADGLYSPDFLKAAGDAAKDMYESSPDFSAFGPAYQDFLAKHQKKYGEKPASVFHAHAYDATNVLFAAIEKVAVQDPDGTLHIGRQALRDAVLATKNFQGLTGNLTCNETVTGKKTPGDCGDPHIAVYQILSADPASWNPGTAANANPKKIYP
jgi:branched-chain amino acid transport system substrate-binding protein